MGRIDLDQPQNGTELMKVFFGTMAVVLLTAACEGSAMRNMSDGELASKRDECQRNNPTAPGRVTACENIRKECERRRTEGNFAC